MKAYLYQIYTLIHSNLKEYFRIRLIITSTSLMPVVMVLAFGLGMHNSVERNSVEIIEGQNYFNYIFPGILALSAMFSSAYSAGYGIMFDREKFIIQDLVISPVSYSSYILARISSTVVKSIPPVFLASIVAIPFTPQLSISHPIITLIAYILTAILFSTVGMIFGSFTGMYSFSGLVNIVLMPSMFFCDVFFPISNYQDLKNFFQLLPFTNSVQLFRYGICGEYSPIGAFLNITIILLYALITLSFWIWWFKKRMAKYQ